VGEHAHIPGWKRDPESKSWFSRTWCGSARKLARQLSISEVTTDWQAAVSRPDVDVVDVVTPSSTHFELAIAALESGKHVLCEKPVAYDYRETRRASELARKKGLKTKLGFTFRYSPGVQCEGASTRGFVGRVFFFNGYEQNPNGSTSGASRRRISRPERPPDVVSRGLRGPIIDIGHCGSAPTRPGSRVMTTSSPREGCEARGDEAMNIDDGDIFIGEHENGA
jgi:predicted dehydrogenase